MNIFGSVITLAFALPFAAAPGPAKPSPPAPPSQRPVADASEPLADKAKRDFDVASVKLQASRLYLGGLHDLAQRPGTWERESFIALFNDAERAVTDAADRIATLAPQAKGVWAKAGAPLRRARSSLISVQRELRELAGPAHASAGDPSTRLDGIRQAWKTLESAERELNSAASAMRLDTRLRTP